MSYKLQKYIKLRKYDDFFILYDYKKNFYFFIDEIGFIILDLLIQGFDKIDTVNYISELYKVDNKEVLNDTNNFIEELTNNNIFINDTKKKCSELINDNSVDYTERYIFNLMSEKSIPFSVTIELLNNCNEDCIHCYRPANSTNIWTIETFEQVTNTLKELGTLHIDLTGGEPFLHPLIFDFIKIANEKGFVITILTNATLINDKHIELLRNSAVRKIYISLYSTVPENHDKITKLSGSYQTTVNVIEKLVANKIPVCLNCPIMSLNSDAVENVKEFADNKQIDCEFSFKISPSQKENKNVEKLNNFSEKLILENALNPNVKLYNPLFQKFCSGNIEKRNSDNYCQAGFRSFTISPKGELLPCTSLRYSFGNILDTNIYDIWKNGKNINKWRFKYNIINNKCSSCEAYEFCEPCPANFYTKNNQFNGIDEITCKFGKTLHNVAKSYCLTK